jgi:hypothetical protein
MYENLRWRKKQGQLGSLLYLKWKLLLSNLNGSFFEKMSAVQLNHPNVYRCFKYIVSVNAIANKANKN